MSEDFTTFLKQRERAASAYVAGDGSGVVAIVPRTGDASIQSPGGDTVTGAVVVAERYLEDAAAFGAEGTNCFEILHRGADGDLGFWNGRQIARARIGDMPEAVDMTLRITEVFRCIESRWRLIHRLADTGASG